MTNALPPNALRRLQRYRGRLEAIEAALQNLQTLGRAYAEQYETALRSACEDHDVELPAEGTPVRVNIDWNSGEVTWEIARPDGLPMSVDGVG